MWRVVLLGLLPGMAAADSVVAQRTIRAQSVLTPQDITLVAAQIPGALTDPAQVLGQEARVAIYPGRPLRAEDIGPPAIVARNQIVSLIFQSGSLGIATEGRALDRGGAGDVIKVMNIASRSTVLGLIESDGSVRVGLSD